MALEPRLWGTLPNELLHLIFACLPVAGIGQLRVLSKEWKRNVDCKDSEFNRHVFDATTHLNMFALVSGGCVANYGGMSYFSINIYDVQEDKWHGYKIKTPHAFKVFANFGGADGGLVCYIPWYNKDPGLFMVMNPLTKQKMQLPPLRCVRAETSNILVTRVRMIRLTMDKKTKDYKVFVVGYSANDFQSPFAQVYHSYTKKWAAVEATQAHIIEWDDHGSLCIYNCADGTLQHFSESNLALELKVEPLCSILLEDHLFILHRETSLDPVDLLEASGNTLSKYCISEFYLPEKSAAWVKLRVHDCGPCKFLYKPHNHFNVDLLGCKGFLLVMDRGYKNYRLYNLSTGEWRIISAFGKLMNWPRKMCTISWSAIA